MATTPELVSMAQQFTGLPMDSLIGAPLIAAAEANKQMSITQTKFLLETCFKYTKGNPNNQPPIPESYEPIMINMSLNRSHVQSGQGTEENPSNVTRSTIDFAVPLLTLIPISSLAVDNVDINFNMEVKSSFAEDNDREASSKTAGEASLEAKVGWGPFSAKITGHVSHEAQNSSSYKSHYQKSNQATYDLKINAKQLPIPEGVGVIIQAFTRSITPLENAETVPAPSEG